MTTQFEITLPPFPRGFHVITSVILQKVGELPETGLMHVHIKHTSAGLTLNENADPTVLHDFETFFSRIIPDGATYFLHNDEGADDMPAHIKASLTGSSVTIPITDRRLNLGTWQGIYLCEFRNKSRARQIVVTILS
jgi:secondary thiamine-phosphate synthase enzyme